MKERNTWNVFNILVLHFSTFFISDWKQTASLVNWNDQLPRDIPIKGFYCNIFLETFLVFFRMEMCWQSQRKKKNLFPTIFSQRIIFITDVHELQ